MNKTNLASLIAGTALTAMAAGCTETANTNTANRNIANSNTAAVVPSNSNATTDTAGVKTINSNSANANRNRNYNISRAEYEKEEKSWREEAKAAGDTIGQSIGDSWIHFKTRGALAMVDDLRDSTINVDVNNGMITLKGTVGSAAQKAAAEKAAKGIEGQKGVKNDLKVSASGDASSNANKAAKNANTKQ